MIADSTDFRNVKTTTCSKKYLEIIWQEQLLEWVNVSYMQTFNIWTARMIMHQYGGDTPWASHTPELLKFITIGKTPNQSLQYHAENYCIVEASGNMQQ